MKHLIFYILIISSIQLSAQEKKEAIIDVVGSAKVSVSPDIGVLNIRLSDIQPQMNEVVSSLGKKSNYYLELLQELGFKEEEIKTTNFSISKNRVYVKRQYVDSGYIASQSIKLEFTYDKKVLTKILNRFSKSKEQIDFSFNFKLSEELKKKVQLQIIENAIEDAKIKSKTIANSAELNLVKIKKIAYGHGTSSVNNMMKFTRESNYAADLSNSDGATYNFTPNDIVMSDNVTVIWFVE